MSGLSTGPVCDHDPWEGWDEDCAANHTGDLAGGIRAELVALWSDLGNARRDALNGSWSVRCDGIVARIVTLSRMVGAAPWGHVDVDTILSGLYVRVHVEHGLHHPAVDWDRVHEVKRRIVTGSSP